MADSENFETRFLTALNDYINTQEDAHGEQVNSARVTGYDTATQWEGYCETCEWERIVIEVYYVDAATSRGRTFTYDGDLGSLMREL